MDDLICMIGVTGGEEHVSIFRKNGELYVVAVNQGGHDVTHVELRSLLRWVAEHMPEEIHRALREEMKKHG